MPSLPSRSPDARILDLPPGARDPAVPVIRESFEGIYRWHANRTLREIPRVRAVRVGEEVCGISMIERLAPEVGYVYYVAVSVAHRGTGLGGILLDDALRIFREARLEVAYAAAEEDNEPSIRLFRSRGFRSVERKELGWKEGGLGAWGLRSRMRLVYGEVLLGLRLAEAGSRPADLPAPGL